MSNFPPGVTGFEPQIAGPSNEWDEERSVVDACGFEGKVEGTVTQWDRFSRTFYWECPKCGEERDEEDEPEDAEEPDSEPEDDYEFEPDFCFELDA